MAEKRKAEEKGIEWRNSAARHVILEDLAAETLPREEDVCSTEEAWKHHRELVEFKDVPFSQFAKQLKEHRATADGKWMRAMKQWADLQQDRAQHAKPTTCDNGRRTFRHSAAHKKLHQDVCGRRHLGLTPTAFRATRPEHQEWELKEFTQRIHQMERQWKFANCLEKKREEKKLEAEAARCKACVASVKKEEQEKKGKKQKKESVAENN